MTYRERRGPRDFERRDDRRDNGGGRRRFDDRRGDRGGPPQRGPPQHRPTECNVVVNLNKLDIVENPANQIDICIYKVSIKNAWWEIQKDGAGEKVTDPKTGRFQRVFKTREIEKGRDGFFNSKKPQRIFTELIKKERETNPHFYINYGDAEIAIAPSNCGPSEDESRYEVSIKEDCDTDHPDADKMRNLWFEVSLVKTNCISWAELKDAILGKRSGENMSDLSTALNIILKSIGTQNGMLSSGSQLPTIFFPLRDQIDIFDNRLKENEDGTKALLSGVKQKAVCTSTGVNIQIDPVVTWFDKEKYGLIEHERIKVIQCDRHGVMAKIAGVEVNLNKLAQDPRTQSDVEVALSKHSLNFEYVIKKIDAKKQEEMLARGKTNREIQESQRRVFLEKVLRTDEKSGLKIMWSPNDHSFEVSGKMTTVSEYYLERYGIELDERMPIVNTGKSGWLPLEFAFQGFAKTKDNGKELVTTILNYYDGIAGTNLKTHMNDSNARLSKITADGLEKYNLRIHNEPTTLKAKVLQTPQIVFQNGRMSTPLNGSFGLRDVLFKNPAEFDSFAIVDCNAIVDCTRGPRDTADYVSLQLKINRRHGMVIPELIEHVGREGLDRVSVVYDPHDAEGRASEAVGRVIEKARDMYLYDSFDMYKKANLWHRTTCYPDMNNPVPVKGLILPPGSKHNPGGAIGIMFDPEKYEKGSSQYCTHDVDFGGPYQCDRARLKVKVINRKEYLDPFDVKDGMFCDLHQVKDGCFITGYAFECHLQNGKGIVYVDAEKVQKMEPLHKETDVKINCPSIIFAILPDSGRLQRRKATLKAPQALYDHIKGVSILSGVQTQCVIIDKYKNQRNPDQYASNIAAKLNAKLSDSIIKSAAWDVCNSPFQGIRWVGECPTLVIGIGMVHGMGSNSDSVVAANVCLDSQCMRLSSTVCLQRKSDVINKHAMKYIITESWEKFIADNKMDALTDPTPKRILVYRDGMSDGNFNKADDEIAAIREAISVKIGASCTSVGEYRKCCPPITYVICQSQNNTRIVPSNENEGFWVNRGGVNVHSGTVVDHSNIIELGTLLNITSEDISSIRALNQESKIVFGDLLPSYDFLLTAQGGLKGTSKPIYYRVRLNENACWGPKGCTALTKENLVDCTYQMAFRYASATKAVRELPVIKYSKKLGNQVLSSLKYIREGVYLGGREFILENPPDSTEDGDDRPFVRVVMREGLESRLEAKLDNVGQFNLGKHLAA